MMPKVSIIVITHNGKRHLGECLESLRKQTYKNFDTYLLDNGSTDGSSEFVKKNFPWVKIIRFDKNFGFAEGYNRALKIIDAEYVALLNDDTVAEPNWLEELVKILESDESIFAVGSKLMFYDKPNIVQHAGGKITIIGAGIDIGFGKKDSQEFNKLKFVGYVCGGAMLLRKRIFEELGGFDSSYFAYFEDVDLCWRAWLCGYKVAYAPKAVVYHKFGGTWGKRSSPLRIYFCHINKLRNIFKNLEGKNVLIGFMISILFDTIRILLFIAKRNFLCAKEIIKAFMDFSKDIKTVLNNRARVQIIRTLKDNDLQKMGLICTFKEAFLEFLRLEFGYDISNREI